MFSGVIDALFGETKLGSSFSNIFGDGVKLCLVGVPALLKGDEFAIGLNRLGENGFGDEDSGDDLDEALE